MKRFWLLLLTVAILLAAGLWLWGFGRPRPVSTATIGAGTAVEMVYATGFVDTDEPVTISSRVTAPIISVLVREGDPVRAGQRLILLDNREQIASGALAAANRRAAVRQEARALKLFSDGWVTRAARDDAEAAADAARAAERLAQAAADQFVLRAAVAGVVLRRDAEAGDLATPGRPLLQIGDPARRRVTAVIDERDIARVRVGQPVLMSSDAEPGKVLHGHVRELTPIGDPEQRTFRARIAIDDGPGLPLGLTLEINIVVKRASNVLLAPVRAIDDGHVWTIVDGRARRRPVITGIEGKDLAEIKSGVASGDRVIIDPQPIAEGDRVRASDQ